MTSPGVQTFERDRTFNVNSIESNASAMVGLFRWGPIESPTLITTNESELVQKFGRPDDDTKVFLHSAANFLLYSQPLYIVRATDVLAKNAVPTGETAILVKNDDDYESAVTTGISFFARYAGALGNSLKFSIADADGFDGWTYEDEFTYTPETGEFNMVVVDEDGLISGTAGTVLEKYELMTTTEGSKKDDGTSAYIKNVLFEQSKYILSGDLTAIDLDASGSVGVYESSLVNGVDGNDDTSADFSTAIATLSDTDGIDIISMFTSGLPVADAKTAIDTMVTRGDAVCFAAPALADVYNNTTTTADVASYFNTDVNKNTSYAFYVDNWKMIYDKYNDENIWIPCDSDAAGLNSRVFVQNEPWMSPAGYNRGQLKNIIRLAWNSNKAQRDILYPSSINSIIATIGEGTLLFGDKTALKRPSAFSRINVRNLLIVLKKSISQSAKYQLFELNDVLTRSIFKKAVDRYLDSVQGRGGLYRYSTVCDETNNTAAVINANEFIGDIYLDPAKSINNIKLYFIAVDTGVEFTEVEGV